MSVCVNKMVNVPLRHPAIMKKMASFHLYCLPEGPSFKSCTLRVSRMAQSAAGTGQSEKDTLCAASQQETQGNILCANLAGLYGSHVLVFKESKACCENLSVGTIKGLLLWK